MSERGPSWTDKISKSNPKFKTRLTINPCHYRVIFTRIMQLQLWGPLLLVIIILALFIWWCRTDEPCCDVEKPCLYRCGCKKEPKDEDESQEVIGE